MKFNMTMESGNAAFEEGACDEVARILGEAISKLRKGYQRGNCVDINGNRVGQWELDIDPGQA